MKTKSLKISNRTRKLYEERNKALDNDPDAPILPIEKWERGGFLRDYRPLKTAVSVRLDNDVLHWLKSKGEGHLTRINEILRARMAEELKARRS